MTAILKVDTIQDTSGNNIINESSDTITIGASGDTTNIVGTLQNNGSALASTNGITEADQWRLSANQELTTNDITANLERVDDTGFGYIGSGMSQSSGVFTFPSTGIYRVEVNATFHNNSGAGESRYLMVRTQTTTNNSSYSNVERAITNINDYIANQVSSSCSSIYLDVTDTSNVKVKFTTSAAIQVIIFRWYIK